MSNKTYTKWTKEKKDYLKEIYKGKTYKEITSLMSKKFNEEYTECQIGSLLKRLKLQTGTTNKFKKGHIPPRKGKGKVKKKHEYKKVGSESINKEGYTIVKLKNNKWELKHRVIYEKYKGDIPPGYIVIFADKNKRNFNPDNLILISRKQQVMLNKNNLIKKDNELTKVGVNIANIILKIGEKRKNE